MGQPMHVVLPRKCRTTMEFRAPVGLQESSITESIHATATGFVYVLSCEHVGEGLYRAVFLTLPESVTDALRENQVGRCILYVGTGDTTMEIRSHAPDLARMATTDTRGDPSPWMSPVLEF